MIFYVIYSIVIISDTTEKNNAEENNADGRVEYKAGANHTNMFMQDFMHADTKSVKRQSSH